MIHRKTIDTNNYTVFDFDSTNDFSIDCALNTTTQGTNFSLNPFYRCRPRRGYSLSTDYFNTWKMQEEPADYSRKDIMKAYRLGSGF